MGAKVSKTILELKGAGSIVEGLRFEDGGPVSRTNSRDQSVRILADKITIRNNTFRNVGQNSTVADGAVGHDQKDDGKTSVVLSERRNISSAGDSGKGGLLANLQIRHCGWSCAKMILSTAHSTVVRERLCRSATHRIQDKGQPRKTMTSTARLLITTFADGLLKKSSSQSKAIDVS